MSSEKIIICDFCHEPYNHKNHAIGGDHRLVLPEEKCSHQARFHEFVKDSDKWVDIGWVCSDCDEEVEPPPVQEVDDIEKLREEIKRLKEYEWKYNDLCK
jgi:hypothetical protein